MWPSPPRGGTTACRTARSLPAEQNGQTPNRDRAARLMWPSETTPPGTGDGRSGPPEFSNSANRRLGRSDGRRLIGQHQTGTSTRSRLRAVHDPVDISTVSHQKLRDLQELVKVGE